MGGTIRGITVAENVPESEAKGAALAQGVESMASKVRNFVSDVITEIRKTSWPSRQELVDSTWVVIVMVLALGMFTSACDWVLIKILGWLARG